MLRTRTFNGTYITLREFISFIESEARIIGSENERISTHMVLHRLRGHVRDSVRGKHIKTTDGFISHFISHLEARVLLKSGNLDQPEDVSNYEVP